jgi:hypothetical protein
MDQAGSWKLEKAFGAGLKSSSLSSVRTKIRSPMTHMNIV